MHNYTLLYRNTIKLNGYIDLWFFIIKMLARNVGVYNSTTVWKSVANSWTVDLFAGSVPNHLTVEHSVTPGGNWESNIFGYT